MYDEEPENDHYNEWRNDNLTDLEIEFLDKHRDKKILDDDIPDFLDDNCDEFEEYVREQYNNADFDIYPPRGSYSDEYKTNI